MAKIGDLISTELKEKMKQSTLKRGFVYNVAVPYKVGLPLYLFHCKTNKLNYEKDKNKFVKEITCSTCSMGYNGSFNDCSGIVREYSDNNVDKISRQEGKSVPINFVQKLKLRPFLIISSNAEILYPGNKFILGLPVYSLKQTQLSNKKFMGKLKANLFNNRYYIEKKAQGVIRPSVIDLQSIIAIPKNLFKDNRGYISPREMVIISGKIHNLLDLNQFGEETDNLDFLNRKKLELEQQLQEINTKIEKLTSCVTSGH